VSNNTNITGNTVNNNGNKGIWAGTSHYNTLLGNTLDFNEYGVFFDKCWYNNFSGNIINHNDWGIYLIGSKNNILANTANYNEYGIYISSGTNNNIIGNTANNNTANGIQLTSSDENILSGNTANNNNLAGIYLYYSNDNEIYGNVLIGNQECIIEEGCRGNIFRDNDSCNYGEVSGVINGYWFQIIIICICSFVIVLIRKLKMRDI
jgi:parallel beta-helix repeat protein